MSLITMSLFYLGIPRVFVQSFRFGAEIAYVAATILTVCKRVEKLLVGGKQKGNSKFGLPEKVGFFKTEPILSISLI